MFLTKKSLTIDAAKGLTKCEQDVGQSLKLRPVQRVVIKAWLRPLPYKSVNLIYKMTGMTASMRPYFLFHITSKYSTKWRLEEYNFCSNGSSSAGRAVQQANRLENRLEASAVHSFRRDAGMTAGHEDRAV
ncbi:hypothetical protein pipiens_010924 [Culex pipiens pipiens]|uniref:Uncharacterized protein n=1 Tax=Culex pipiens pipiens TaxID=38569 RepID=A0ABD1D899_CULPP